MGAWGSFEPAVPAAAALADETSITEILGHRTSVLDRLDRLGADAAPAGAAMAATADERGANPLRPRWLDDMIGQARLRRLLRRYIDAALAREQPLDHTLLVGGSGTGKSTIANIIANELGVAVYQVEAPISQATLLELRTVMQDRDVLFIDEVHQQAASIRGAKDAATSPEVLFNVMEDRSIVSGIGVLPFPKVTVIGATTDEGELPEPFLNRFPLRPVIEPYTPDELATMAGHNAVTLGLSIDPDAAALLAGAARETPRVVNNYVKNAASLTASTIDLQLATEVLEDLNGVTPDGLTRDMRNTLVFMFQRCKRTNKSDQETYYQASLSTIATAIGKSRDVKAVGLRVEPWLIKSGLLQVTNGGRRLTDAGIARAKELA
jgi:Holliday junction DNA helicase RuvB